MARICFAADLHGNMAQYRKLISFGQDFDIILVGGDIAPKDHDRRTVQAQRDFLEKELIPLLKTSAVPVGIIMGNDDFKDNVDILEREDGFVLLTTSKKDIGGVSVCGYPYVPLTPFRFKDWEKLDVADRLETEYRHSFVLDGVRSSQGELIPFSFSLSQREDTIKKDLKGMKGDVWVVHAPPFKTSLDLMKDGHVGSIAVKEAIENEQPLITFHGHVHETVDLSGEFKHKIGKTWCYSPGNDFKSKTLHVIVVDTAAPGEGKRIALKAS